MSPELIKWLENNKLDKEFDLEKNNIFSFGIILI